VFFKENKTNFFLGNIIEILTNKTGMVVLKKRGQNGALQLDNSTRLIPFQVLQQIIQRTGSELLHFLQLKYIF
jgi:hypothetical protein